LALNTVKNVLILKSMTKWRKLQQTGFVFFMLKLVIKMAPRQV